MKRIILIIGLIFGTSGCLEDVGLFFAFNVNDIEEAIQEGEGVIVIGVANEDSDSAKLVSGQLPAGLTLEPDGTVQGIPEETGTFEFAIETVEADGSSMQQNYVVEITEGHTPP